MVVELGVDEEVVDDGRVDDGELRPQRDHDRALHQQGEGREGATVGGGGTLRKLQSDTIVCSLGSVDIKTQVLLFKHMSLILIRKFCF